MRQLYLMCVYNDNKDAKPKKDWSLSFHKISLSMADSFV